MDIDADDDGIENDNGKWDKSGSASSLGRALLAVRVELEDKAQHQQSGYHIFMLSVSPR